MLHVDFLVADVDVVLEVEEIAVADAEILAEAQGCVHRDFALVAQDLLDARYRHMDVFRQPVRRDPHRLHELLPEDFRHGRCWYHVFHVDHLLSMIIFNLYVIETVAAVHPEADPVLLVDANAVFILSLPGKLLQVIGWWNP